MRKGFWNHEVGNILSIWRWVVLTFEETILARGQLLFCRGFIRNGFWQCSSEGRVGFCLNNYEIGYKIYQ